MENKVLAVIKGREITEQDVNELLQRMPEDQRRYYDTEMGRERLLDELVNLEVFYNYALELELDKNPIYLEQLEMAKRQILFPLAADLVTRDVDIKEEDVLKFYETNKNLFKSPEKARASHILVDNEEDARSIKQEIQNGLSFEEAAAKYSSCPSKQQGGDLGAFGRGQMVPEFEEAAFSLPIGVVSEPVKTQFGYHLVKVKEFHPAVEQSFNEVKDSITERMIQERKQYRFLGKADELKTQYNVEYKK